MLELRLTKMIWGSRLVGYLSKYHPYILTSNDVLKCWELILKRFSDFSVYMGWIVVDGET